MEIRFVVTANCNFNCYFCLNEYIGKKHNYFKLDHEDYAFIRFVARRYLDINEFTITGGEPFTRGDIGILTRSLNDGNSHITIVSNGSLLNNHIDTLRYIDELHVSIHAFDEENWLRITRCDTKALQKRVLQNLAQARDLFPNLPIKINVVSEKANNNNEVIQKYIDFASKLNFEINVFKEGYSRIAKLMGIEIDLPRPEPVWDLNGFKISIVDKRPRKKTYLIGNVVVSLCNTSPDENSWDSLWIGPKAICFSDVYQRSPAIDLYNLIRHRDEEKLFLALKSVADEAKMRKTIEGNNIKSAKDYHRLNRLIQNREKGFQTKSMIMNSSN
jgi:pyruvate-formate lyase-activating enzyme